MTASHSVVAAASDWSSRWTLAPFLHLPLQRHECTHQSAKQGLAVVDDTLEAILMITRYANEYQSSDRAPQSSAVIRTEFTACFIWTHLKRCNGYFSPSMTLCTTSTSSNMITTKGNLTDELIMISITR